jgi:hypothetical protein
MLGAGGGGTASDRNGYACGDGLAGGGIAYVIGRQIQFQGGLSSSGAVTYSTWGGGGAGGSIRIDGYNTSLNTAVVNGSSSNGSAGGLGRIAVYYDNAFSGNFTPGYQSDITPIGGTATPTPTPIVQTPQPTQAGWVGTTYTYTTAHPPRSAGSATCRDGALERQQLPV